MKKRNIIIALSAISLLFIVSACTASDMAAFKEGYNIGSNPSTYGF